MSKIMIDFQNLINQNKFLLEIIEDEFNHSTKILKRADLMLKPFYDRKLVQIIKWYERTNNFELQMFRNYTPEEFFLIKLAGYITLEGKILSIKSREIIQKNLNDKLLKEHWLICDDELTPDTKIKNNNIYFSKNFYIIEWLLLSDTKSRKSINITESLVEKINMHFNAGIINTRSFESTIERYNETFTKINTSTYVLKHKNSEEICKQINARLNEIEFNFLLPDYFKKIISNIIEKYNLLEDEAYYLFSDYSNKENNGLVFSKGNSMFISKSHELANLKLKDRLSYVFTNPIIMSKTELALLLGLNSHAATNIKSISHIEDSYFYFDKNNISHIKFIKERFNDFKTKKSDLLFNSFDLREYCKWSNDIFLQSLSKIFDFSFLKDVYSSEIEWFKNSRKFRFKINNNTSNKALFIHPDDWEEN